MWSPPISRCTAANRELRQIGGQERQRESEHRNLDLVELESVTTAVLTEPSLRAVSLRHLLSGQSVQDYDFPYLKAVRINQQYLAYNYFGFSDDKQRETALKKFKESQEKKDKK